VILRFLQGFALGGEWGGAVLLVAEHSPRERRGFWASWPQAAVPVGNLLATLVLFVLSSTLTHDAFLGWGWRIAFWLSAVIVLIGWYIRTKVTEAPIFLEMKEQQEQEAAKSFGPLEVVRRYPRGVLVAMGLRVAENILYYVVVTFSIVYLTQTVKEATSATLLILAGAHVVHFIVVPLWGRLSDRWGRKPVYATGALLGAAWGFFAFPMMSTGSPIVIWAAIALGLVFHAAMYAGQPALMAEMFPTRMRYSGVSLGYQVTSIFAGSLAPIIATSLLAQYHSSVPVAVYVAIACAITLVAVAAARETKGADLRALDADDRTRLGQEAGSADPVATRR
jgi:MFS family permease